jgi:hypothetical protein
MPSIESPPAPRRRRACLPSLGWVNYDTPGSDVRRYCASIVRRNSPST